MQAKYQIFVSSTYEDLRPERDAVIRAILEMGHIPVGMEMFSAADEEQWTIIRRHIDESDYYIVVIGHRYGSMTPEGISFTQKEYEHARASGIPILAFLIADDAPWNSDFIDKDELSVKRLKNFKILARSKPISVWRDPNDLYGKAAIALGKAFNAQPRPGWIRAGEAVGPQVMTELTRLSSENDKLRSELAQAGRGSEDEVDTLIRELSNSDVQFQYRASPDGPWQVRSASLLELFDDCAKLLLTEATVRSIGASWARLCRLGESWKGVDLDQVRGTLADFLFFGVAKPSKRKHSYHNEEEYWTLTKFGRDVLKKIRASRVDILQLLSDAETFASHPVRSPERGEKPEGG